MQFVIVLVVAILGFALYKKWKSTHVVDLDIPAPSVLRNDLKYGYYACETGPDFTGTPQNQPAETKSHVNLFWEAQFRPQDTASNILTMQMTTILDVANQMMVRVEKTGRNFHYNPDAPRLLAALFSELQAAGALKYVKVIYPMDEPNINTNAGDLKLAIDTIRQVAANFPDLKDVKLMCIYAAKPETYECIEEFDFVGVDDYEQKSTIFADGFLSKGAYTKLRERMASNQKSIIIPGGAFGQDPIPFVNIAHTYKEVWAIVPFCWFGRREAADNWIGIRDPANGRHEQYIAAGLSIKASNPN